METKRLVGTFQFDNASHHFGELDLNGDLTNLRIFGQKVEEFEDCSTIRGKTDRNEKVTCLGCQSREIASFGFEEHGSQSVSIFPHYVTIGHDYIPPEQNVIRQVSFSFTDIASIFKDTQSFGSIMSAGEELQIVLNTRRPKAGVLASKNSLISYFSGDFEAIRIRTSIGEVVAWNRFEVPSAGPFTHDLRVSIKFEKEITFDECIKRIQTLRQFLVFLSGRAQAISSLEIGVASETMYNVEGMVWLQVYWSLPPAGPIAMNGEGENIRDLPLHAAKDSQQFQAVMANWIARQDTWHVPRMRYLECVELGRRYTASRIIAAANMFDLLPDSAVPTATEIDADLRQVAEQARAKFKALPDGPERNSILGALGRIGKPSLSQKVFYRADIVWPFIPRISRNIRDVLKIAVQCRNYFVHGSEFDYDLYADQIDFLTDSLEFVFAASDLIESGWDVSNWSSRGFVGDHQFSFFVAHFAENLEKFLALKR